MYRPESITTTGIMFDHVNGDATPFPTLADMPYSWVGDGVDHDHPLAGWLVVASNPGRVHYYDDDREAMDETNYDVVAGEDVPSVWRRRSYQSPDIFEGADEASAHGWAEFGRVLICDPNNEEAIERFESYRDALADYPLLDEDEYSKREHEAWCAWASTGGLQYDTMRELTDAGWDPDTIARIDAQWDHVWPAMSSWLDYYYGFTGECSSVPDAITRAMAEGDVVLNYVAAVDVDEYA